MDIINIILKDKNEEEASESRIIWLGSSVCLLLILIPTIIYFIKSKLN